MKPFHLPHFSSLSSLQKAGIASLGLHVTLLLFLSFAPSAHRSKNTPHPTHSVIVDFVKVGPKSMAPMLGPQTVAASKPSPKKTSQAAAPAPAARTAKAEKPTPPPASKAPKNAFSKPAVKPKPALTPSAKPAAKPTVKPTVKKTPNSAAKNAKNSAKPRPKASPSKTNPSVNKAKVDLAKKGTAAQSVSDFLNKKKGTGGAANSSMAMAEMLGEELTGTDIDVLNRHMKSFWNLPSGHEKAHSISVEVELFISRDGTITKASIVDQQRLRTDPEFRIAAESAMRAVLDPECSPLPLDPAKYESWKHMIFVFDPSEMCN